MVLTACGNKAAVKSEKPAQTVLEQATPVSTETSSIQAPSMGTEVKRVHHSYAKKSPVEGSSSTSTTSPAIAETKSPEKPAPAPARTPITASDKKSSNLWLILLGLAVVGGAGYYLVSRKSSRKNRPLPPHGGLSPVSGFTAMKDRVRNDAPKSSFWSKKIR
jgi:LPXTG-motif cell wall-anchored protein